VLLFMTVLEKKVNFSTHFLLNVDDDDDDYDVYDNNNTL